MLVVGDPALGHGGTPSQEAEDAEWYLRPAAEQRLCTDRCEDMVRFMDAQAGPALARWSLEERSLGWNYASEPLMFGQNAELDLSQSVWQYGFGTRGSVLCVCPRKVSWDRAGEPFFSMGAGTYCVGRLRQFQIGKASTMMHIRGR